MRTIEQRLWDRMRSALSGPFYLERVENAVMPGRPDVDLMWHGVTLPIELKAKKTSPARSATPVLGKDGGLNPHQLNWWLTWQQRGGHGFILVEICDVRFALPTECSEKLNGMVLSDFMPYAVTWGQFEDVVRQEIYAIKRTR